MKSWMRAFEGWLHEPAPAERLAALRIAIGGFVCIYLLANVGEVQRMGSRDPRAFDPIGVVRLLDTPLSSTTLMLLFIALIIAGAGFTLGVATRVVGPVFAFLVLCWTSYHSSWGQLLHFEHLFTLHVMILSLAPTADAWAVRTPWRPRRLPIEPSVRYGWPIRLLALTTVITYVLSGIAKLRHSGFEWFDPDTLAAHIGYSTTRLDTIGARTPPLARPVLQAQWLLVPIAAVALLVELGAPLALWRRSLRNLWVCTAIAFHAGTAATMLVFFGYRGLGFAMLPLFHVERVPERVMRRMQQRRAPRTQTW